VCEHDSIHSVYEDQDPGRDRPGVAAEQREPGEHRLMGHRAGNGLGRHRRHREGRPEFDAPAGQPLSQQLPPAFEPNLDRARRDTEIAGRLVPAFPVQAACDQYGPVLFRQAGEFLVEDAGEFARRHAGGPVRNRLFAALAEQPAVPGVLRHADGDFVDPPADRLPPPDGVRLPGENEEHGLKRILRVRVIAEDPPARGKYERAVPPDERREREFVSRCGKEID
jgi:hypothetical protein